MQRRSRRSVERSIEGGLLQDHRHSTINVADELIRRRYGLAIRPSTHRPAVVMDRPSRRVKQLKVAGGDHDCR